MILPEAPAAPQLLYKLNPQDHRRKSEQKREKEIRGVKDICVAFSDLGRPEMKPGDLSGGPKESCQYYN